MSLVSTVNGAIKAARQGLQDLVQPAVLRTVTSTYNTDTGTYENATTDYNVEIVKDTFTYHEQQIEDYRQTDIKVVMFNPDDSLNPTISHLLVMNGSAIPIIKAEPINVGSTIPVWVLVLRK